MQEVNNEPCALNKWPGQNRGQNEKEDDLDPKIPARFALKIIAADIEK